MKKLTTRELSELQQGNVEIDAITRKERKQKKKKRNHIYNKESE
jgi:hypothetical protein